MASLVFRSILSTGTRDLGDGEPDQFFSDINLSDHEHLPALLLLETKNVSFLKNFISINAVPEDVMGTDYERSRDEYYFAQRLLENPTDNWVLQVVYIPAGHLREDNNRLGIHSRNEQGNASGNRDNFCVCRIFLIYFGDV